MGSRTFPISCRAGRLAAFAACWLTLSLPAPWRTHAATPAPDLIIHGAKILTMNPAQPSATALAVWRGRFLAVGSDPEALALRGSETRVWHAGGRTIVPGFNDAHLHPRPEFPEDSIHADVDLGPERVPDSAALVRALRARATRTPTGTWIRGVNYQDTKLGGHPTRALLDSVSTNHPILLAHSSGHLWTVNSAVLGAARITAATPDPAGGGFGRDAGGEPNGLLREQSALRLVQAAGPKSPEPAWSELLEGYERCFDRFLAEGLTSVTDAGGTPEALRIYQELARRDHRIRVNVLIKDSHLEQVKAAGMRSGFGDDWVRLAGIKIVHGNSLSGRTCWLSEPYETLNPATGRMDYYGIPPARSQADLDALIANVHSAGLQPAVHANGDREIAMVLDAFERALQARPAPDHRFRVEHASVCPGPLLKRARDLGVVLALHSYIYEHGDKMEDYGSARWEVMHPNRAATELGLVVAANSDWPVSAAMPMRRIQSLVTRATAAGKVYGASQRVPVETALRLWTVGGAFATFQEGEKGSVTPGLLADFVVLSADPRAVLPENLEKVLVEATYVGGRRVYARGHPLPAP